MARRGLDTSADPHSLAYDLGRTERQTLWRVCCASVEDHRFDCDAVVVSKRGAGPFGPVRPASPADLVRRLRSP